ncbi:MAG: glycosyltransferase family 4 protein, partial [Lachnospiraceae bacterium]|nr:glycosyltransferase family 4 protein [Lachnospiraceae bacterium]
AMQIGENSAYKKSDYVVSLLPCAKKYMMKHGLKEEKFVHIPNGVVLEDWATPEELPTEHKEILEKLKSDGKFVVGYFGGHALSNALDTLIDAAEKLKDKQNIHIVLVGEGVEKERLIEKANKLKLNNVTFLAPVPKLSIPNLVQYFDATYNAAKASPLYRFGVCPNKVFDTMMAAKPLLYAIDAPASYVNKYGCGIDVIPESVESLVGAITHMSEVSKSERVCMGEKGKKAVETKYNYKVLGKYFAKLFN